MNPPKYKDYEPTFGHYEELKDEKLPKFVGSEIYLITCIHPKSQYRHYIGQTRTHVLDHNKYRPFGSYKRWLQHVSEAEHNNGVKQSWKLNDSIRKYGQKCFTVEILLTCEVKKANEMESKFIWLYDSIKNGLNITPQKHA